MFLFQTSDVRSKRQRDPAAPKSPSSPTKCSIMPVLRAHDLSLNYAAPSTNTTTTTTSILPPASGPRQQNHHHQHHRRYPNIAWFRKPRQFDGADQHAVLQQPVVHTDVPFPKRMQSLRHTTAPNATAVRPPYNTSVYRINRINPPNTISKDATTTIKDNPSVVQAGNKEPHSSGEAKWISSYNP